jgi:hypothetical protein
MDESRAENDALEFYYYGFYAALRRFRAVAVVGWLVALLGFVAFFFAWDIVRPGGWFNLFLCCGTVVSGIAVVQIAVSALNAYVRIPFSYGEDRENGAAEVVDALRLIMREVEEGGWREAQVAIRGLLKVGERFGLPHPDRPGIPRK